MAAATSRADWIIDQLDLMVDVADVEVRRGDVLAAARELLGTEGWEEIPDSNTRAEQSNWLQHLFEAAVKKSGGEVVVGQKDPIPTGGSWSGGTPDVPPGFPGR